MRAIATSSGNEGTFTNHQTEISYEKKDMNIVKFSLIGLIP